MFEGKHIHFNPLDHKPLCSYSNKLCRQRRLNGYAFCIRHILEDKSAPFKQCDFVTRNNSQKCLNAIPKDEERGYCHSHMQVAGIIPKTERKTKTTPSLPLPSAGKGDPSSGSGKGRKVDQGVGAGGNMTMIGSSGDTKSKVKSFKTVKNGKEIPVTNQLSPSSSVEKPNNVKSNPSTKKGEPIKIIKNGQLKETINKGSKCTGPPELVPKTSEGSTASTPTKTSKALSKKKTQNTGSTKGNVCIRDKWKWFNFSPPNLSLNRCLLNLEQLKTFKVLEKLPLFPDGAPPSFSTETSFNQNKTLHQKPKISIIDSDQSDEGIEMFLPPLILRQGELPQFPGEQEGLKKTETRKEFLSRVRSVYKTREKNIRRAHDLNKKHDKKAQSTLREALLQCSLEDPDGTVQSLISTDPRFTTLKEALSLSNVLQVQESKKSKADQVQVLCDQSQIELLTTGSSTKHKIIDGVVDDKVDLRLYDEFEEAFSSVNYSSQLLLTTPNKDDKLCDSSPWLNGACDVSVSDLFSLHNGLDTPNKDTKEGSLSTPYNDPFGRQSTTRKKSPGYLNGISPNNNNNLLDKCNRNLRSLFNNSSSHQGQFTCLGLEDNLSGSSQFFTKKRRTELDHSSHNGFHSFINSHLPLDNGGIGDSAHFYSTDMTSGLEQVLGSVSSTDTGVASDGVITDNSFDSPFDHSTSSHPDCDFTDDMDDLEKNLELPIDPESAHEASRLFEENRLTDDDFNELFPSDHKLGSDMGMDFGSTFDGNEIDYNDYGIFANILNCRSNGLSHESISVNQNF